MHRRVLKGGGALTHALGDEGGGGSQACTHKNTARPLHNAIEKLKGVVNPTEKLFYSF
jgi:hypothetical protein